MHRWLTALLFPAWEAEARTAIVKAGEGWKLEVDGKPYVAKGVTFSGTGGGPPASTRIASN